MRNPRTPLLTVIAVLSAIAALAAYSRLERLRGNALAGERDLGIVHRDLMAITQANGGPQIAVGRVDSNELTRRLNSAAVIAGVRDQLVDIDPGAPARVENHPATSPFERRIWWFIVVKPDLPSMPKERRSILRTMDLWYYREE